MENETLGISCFTLPEIEEYNPRISSLIFDGA